MTTNPTEIERGLAPISTTYPYRGVKRRKIGNCTPVTLNSINKSQLPIQTEISGSASAIYGNKNGHKYPEETETVSGGTPSTKRYKGVWRRKSGKWVARTRDPVNNVRVWVGTYDSDEEASKAYFSKKAQFMAIYEKLGSLIVDNNGFLLGEFSSMDDLQIC